MALSSERPDREAMREARAARIAAAKAGVPPLGGAGAAASQGGPAARGAVEPGRIAGRSDPAGRVAPAEPGAAEPGGRPAGRPELAGRPANGRGVADVGGDAGRGDGRGGFEPGLGRGAPVRAPEPARPRRSAFDAPADERPEPDPERQDATRRGLLGFTPLSSRAAFTSLQDAPARPSRVTPAQAPHDDPLDLALSELTAARAEIDRLQGLIDAGAARGSAELQAREAAARAEEAAARAEKERHTQAVAALDAVRGTLVERREALQREVRAEIGPLLLAAARGLAGRALSVSPTLLADMVEEMAGAIGRASLVVRVSPADAPGLREHLPGVTIQADPSVSAGCACSSPNGEIDATFEATVVGLEAILSRWGGE